MFPYLRTANEFLSDCKTIGYGIKGDGAESPYEVTNDEADYIKNAYRVLLTRGLKKCRILIKEGCDDTLLYNMKAWRTRGKQKNDK